ncbi:MULTISPECIES: transglutaminase TgpA family protein [unclassified Knoellia]|uniref:transglutaminase TgpA family protein n=1 Tax=Knoellia altitudinis TaxID=3404795 RepID=UPI0036171AB1
MNRVRPVETLLASLASFTVALPLLTLFDANTWVRPAVVIVATIALVGLGLRALVLSAWAVILGQLFAGFLAVSWMHGQGHLYGGVLPGPDTVTSLGILLGEAGQTVMAFSVPVPTERGIVVAITILIGATALVVDAVAVTLRSPALAGLALLTAYLVSATNSGDGLSWRYFVLPVGFWLALLAAQGIGTVRRWSTAVPRGQDGEDHDPVLGVAGTARLLGAGTLALAVVVPMVVPHLPTTFLADGLGRADNSRGGGAITLNTTVDLRRSLEDQSQSPVITYKTTSSAPDPLRVGILTDYRGGEWSTRFNTNRPLAGGPQFPDADPSVERTTVEVTVEENRLQAPQIALPTPLLNVDVGEVALRTNFAGSIAVDRNVEEYTATYGQLAPEASNFSSEGQRPRGWDEGVYNELDGESLSRLTELVDSVVPSDATPLETARLLQAHFRSTQYTYSLQLPTPTDPVSGRTMMSDPLSNFLVSRTGYCVQFASAFIMAARVKGIPARMAIGFLPGTFSNGSYTVRSADAHAWPELWFPDLGWTRFEPTPGVRTGGAPVYSLIPSESNPSASATPTPTAATPTPSASQRPDGDPGVVDDTTTASRGPLTWLGDHALTLLAALAVVLSLLLLPVAAWVRRRRLRVAARDDAERVEADWASLISRLGDIGIAPPDGSTPRQAGARLTHDAILSGESKEAMGRIVATVEQARYAPPRTQIPDVSADTHTVWRAAVSARQRSDQLRAYLAPGDGVRQWAAARDAVLAWPRAAWSRLRRD